MKIGNHNKLPQYSVHGVDTRMYLWINEDGRGKASSWFSGRNAFKMWHELEAAFKKDKKLFIKLVKDYHDA